MKNLKLLVIIMITLTGCLFLDSCSNKSQKSGDETEIEQNEDVSDTSSLQIEPVLWCFDLTRGSSDCFIACDMYGFAVRDSSGEIIQFDNDEDYADYCQIINFIRKAASTPFYNLKSELREKYDVPTFYTRTEWDKWVSEHQEDVAEINQEIARFWTALTRGVIDYSNGDKDNISDPEIFEIIDKAYYNYHPDDHYYHCDRSIYNLKNYSDEENKNRIAASTAEYGFRAEEKSVFTNGEKVPDKALMLH